MWVHGNIFSNLKFPALRFAEAILAEPSAAYATPSGGRAIQPGLLAATAAPYRLSRILLLIVAIAIVSLLHFTVAADSHRLHLYHVIFRSLYFLPIIAAAIWFYLRGALLIALIITIIYSSHVVMTWWGQAWENTNQFAMLGLYWLTAGVAGTLSSMEHREHKKREAAERSMHREVIVNSLEGLSQALKWRDEYTQQHSENVAALAVRIGAELGLAPDRIEVLRLAARVHDIGKIGVRDDILLKPEQLSSMERKIIELHPVVAADILRPIAWTEEVADIVLAHHECPDGSGYPRGIIGADLPAEARILSVADMFSALTEDRPYKRGMDYDEAIGRMDMLSGTKLDPNALDALKITLTRECHEG